MASKIHTINQRPNRLPFLLQETKIQPVSHPVLDEAGVSLSIKRDDQIHPIISGNKWRKLKYTLDHALSMGFKHLISMGGPWSNHLHALAFMGHQIGIRTTGIVRGEVKEPENPCLAEMRQWGMEIIFVNRIEFRQLRQFHHYKSKPGEQYHGYWIPEGGATRFAMAGIRELVAEINVPFDTLAVACGTGTTLAGVASALPAHTEALGIAVLKDAGFLNRDVEALLGEWNTRNWSINLDYHFGGFGKADDDLLKFIDEFEKQTDTPLDPIYTGKLFYSLLDMVRKKQFTAGHRIIAIHTGGLQGRRGFHFKTE